MSEALTKLGESTAEACLGVLEMFAADKVSLFKVITAKDEIVIGITEDELAQMEGRNAGGIGDVFVAEFVRQIVAVFEVTGGFGFDVRIEEQKERREHGRVIRISAAELIPAFHSHERCLGRLPKLRADLFAARVLQSFGD